MLASSIQQLQQLSYFVNRPTYLELQQQLLVRPSSEVMINPN